MPTHIPCPSRLPVRPRHRPEDPTYTVFGLVDNTAQPRQLTIAGVIAGDHPCLDSDDNGEDRQRWAGVFQAASVKDAEEQAHAEVEADSDDDADQES